MAELVSLSSDALQHVMLLCECVEDVGSIARTCWELRNILNYVLRTRAQRAGRVVPDESTTEELAWDEQAAAGRWVYWNKRTGSNDVLVNMNPPGLGDVCFVVRRRPVMITWDNVDWEGYVTGKGVRTEPGLELRLKNGALKTAAETWVRVPTRDEMATFRAHVKILRSTSNFIPDPGFRVYKHGYTHTEHIHGNGFYKNEYYQRLVLSTLDALSAGVAFVPCQFPIDGVFTPIGYRGSRNDFAKERGLDRYSFDTICGQTGYFTDDEWKRRAGELQRAEEDYSREMFDHLSKGVKLTLRNYHDSDEEQLTGMGYPVMGDSSRCPTCDEWKDYISNGMYMCMTCD
jgi:hypothetical protein